MKKYRLLAKKGEGTFSEVLRAQNIKTGKHCAIKCMKSKFDSVEQVNNLREIQSLRRVSPHPNIIKLEEVLYDQPTGRLALVFELMEMNLYDLIKDRSEYLDETLVARYMWQSFNGLAHMHRKGIFHRDIKPENILLAPDGMLVKIADFGSCRGIHSKQPYTEYISTRWYRSPECLLTNGYYGAEMDIWGLGCVMFEIMSLYPLFPGQNEADQVDKIHRVMGTPSPETLAPYRKVGASHVDFDNLTVYTGTPLAALLPSFSNDALDLLRNLLKYNAKERLTAEQALNHRFFDSCRNMDLSAGSTPTNKKAQASEDPAKYQTAKTSGPKEQPDLKPTKEKKEEVAPQQAESNSSAVAYKKKRQQMRAMKKKAEEEAALAEKAAEASTVAPQQQDAVQKNVVPTATNNKANASPAGEPLSSSNILPSITCHVSQQQQQQGSDALTTMKKKPADNSSMGMGATGMTGEGHVRKHSLNGSQSTAYDYQSSNSHLMVEKLTKQHKGLYKSELPQLIPALGNSPRSHASSEASSSVHPQGSNSILPKQDLQTLKQKTKKRQYRGRNGKIVQSKVYAQKGGSVAPVEPSES